MILSFTLTMPNRGSWNGQWSGQGNLYAKTRTFGNGKTAKERAAKLTERPNYYYRWSDGWGANVKVEIVTSAQAAQIRKHSKGFCGYEWMIDSILDHRKIYASHEEIPKAETTEQNQVLTPTPESTKRAMT